MSEADLSLLEQQAINAFLRASDACMQELNPETPGWRDRERLCERSIELQASHAFAIRTVVEQRVEAALGEHVYRRLAAGA